MEFLPRGETPRQSRGSECEGSASRSWIATALKRLAMTDMGRPPAMTGDAIERIWHRLPALIERVSPADAWAA